MISMKVKSLFLDAVRVKRAVDAGTRRALSKSGAFIRQTARRSLRPRRRMKLSEMPDEMRERYRRTPGRDARGKFVTGGPKRKLPWASSKPGQPPRVRKGSPLKELLFYTYDPKAHSVVIGPVGFKSNPAPETLEHGGRTRIRKRVKGKPQTRTAKVQPRPFMGPALAKERPQLPRRWAGSVKG